MDILMEPLARELSRDKAALRAIECDRCGTGTPPRALSVAPSARDILPPFDGEKPGKPLGSGR